LPSAALVVVGNEILTGKFSDENGPWLIKRLRALGCDLVRVAVVRDRVDEIAAEVRTCLGAADRVITSGGVGPTHDDVTFEGVAAALGVGIEERSELTTLIERYGIPLDAANRRMATLPEGATLESDPAVSFPVVRCGRVYVLPGVPKLFRLKFEAVSAQFAGDAVSTARLYVTESEPAIAERLTGVAARFPRVDIGSYPRFGEGPFQVVITLESRDAADVAAAGDAVRAAMATITLPSES